jgi:hypothetical protein
MDSIESLLLFENQERRTSFIRARHKVEETGRLVKSRIVSPLMQLPFGFFSPEFNLTLSGYELGKE